MGKGQKLWQRAKTVIPGGNFLLSKNPEMFAPDIWPAYFDKALGCSVWDLDGREYTDMSIMGIGTNVLGYSDPRVDQAVLTALKKGNMSTLNCPEEVYLAETLVEIHPWSEMVRLARTGGEANAVAVRVARAASGRDGIAVCGYHGWHDWYLAANLSGSDSLDSHLLPGLKPLGVPSGLAGTVHPFQYNDLEKLREIVSNFEIGAVKMEVRRNFEPQSGFLESVRDICSQEGIVLIFDECTTGFRESYGGLHLRYGVNPDMAMFGKALGNGYAITAVLGSREVMEASQDSFISSTFWTERVGPVAALACLDAMKSDNSGEIVGDVGRRIINGWKDIALTAGLQIDISGMPSLASFRFSNDKPLECKTFFVQEMLKLGYLAGPTLYASQAHAKSSILDQYLSDVSTVFEKMAVLVKCGSIENELETQVCRAGFKRLA